MRLKPTLWNVSVQIRALVAFVFFQLTMHAVAETILVAPPELDGVEGNTSFMGGPAPSDTNGLRVHDIHPSSHFAGLPEGQNTITRIKWRPDRVVAAPFTFFDPEFQLLLSTTNASPRLSTTFEENIGEDETLVFSGIIQFETGAEGPASGPHPFDYVLDLQTPFFYDPAHGNLLVEYRFSPESVLPGIDGPFFDGHTVNGVQAIAANLYDAGGELVPSGDVFPGLAVKEFTFVADDEVPPPKLEAGDADQDGDFDQLDLVMVQQAAKYLTGQAATWGEGDWDGAPGGTRGNPPSGSGFFDQLDIIVALGPGHYLTGPYAAVAMGGTVGDGQTSIVYNPSNGELGVDAPAGMELTSVNIDSAAGIFTGAAASNLGGSFDNDEDRNIFKATFGSSFGSLSFGNVAQPGLEEEFLLQDISVVGSLEGGGPLGEVDLIYVPEPGSIGLLVLGILFVAFCHLRDCEI